MLTISKRLFARCKTTRYPTSKEGKILFRNRSCQMNCKILEISNTGARLLPDDPVLLPNEFDLVITPEQRVKCETVHRSVTEIGVQFR